MRVATLFMQSFSRVTPAWLRIILVGQPALMSRWLAWQERRRRLDRWQAVIVLGSLLVVAALLSVAAWRLHPSWIGTLRDYSLLILALSTLHAATSVARRQRRAMAEWSESWLATAPLSPRSVRAIVWLDSFAMLFVQYLIACGALAVLASAGHDSNAATLPLAALTAGIIVGSAFALSSPERHRRDRFEASRYAPSIASREKALQPSDLALSHWPVARAVSMGRPENARWLFAFVATNAIQAGTSAIQGLVILLWWTIAAYLVSLLGAGVSARAHC